MEVNKPIKWEAGMLGYFGKLKESSKLFIVKSVGVKNVRVYYLNSKILRSLIKDSFKINAEYVTMNDYNRLTSDIMVDNVEYRFDNVVYSMSEYSWIFTFKTADNKTIINTLKYSLENSKTEERCISYMSHHNEYYIISGPLMRHYGLESSDAMRKISSIDDTVTFLKNLGVAKNERLGNPSRIVNDELEAYVMEWLFTELDEDDELIFIKKPSDIRPDVNGFYDLVVAVDDDGYEFQVSINPQAEVLRIDNYEVILDISTFELGSYESVCAYAQVHPNYVQL